MPDALCSRCLRSFDEAELFAFGGELLCPACQLLAQRSPAAGDRAEGEGPPPAPAGPGRPPAEETATGAPRGFLRGLHAAAAEPRDGREPGQNRKMDDRSPPDRRLQPGGVRARVSRLWIERSRT